MLENPWVPDDIKAGLFPKQVEFLCYEGREALYGGAAGGGKSVALLVAALQYVEEPGYAALILRRTYKQLAKSDSILSKAKEWLLGRTDPKGRKVRWNGDEHKFTFPSGATLEFGHMDTEGAMYDYQGGSWPFVAPDETTQFTEKMLAYPRTRQRRPVRSRVPIRWRGGTNPGGIGHEYVKARFVKRPDGTDPQTPDRQFFPARLDDNPHIDRDDYVKQLQESGIDGLLLAQLLRGDWDAVAGGRFVREWFLHRYTQQGDYLVLRRPGVDGETRLHWPVCQRFVTVDPAASEKNTSDWTVAAVWLVTPRKELLLLDLERFRAEPPHIVPRVESLWRKWHQPDGVWVEAVAANNAIYKFAKETAMPARPLSPLSADKLVRATLAINFAATGRFWLPAPGVRAGLPLDVVESELYRFTGDDKKDDHDDVVDNFSYAAKVLGSAPAMLTGHAPQILGGGR